MLNRMILGVVAFTISNAAVAAKDEAKKEGCPSSRRHVLLAGIVSSPPPLFYSLVSLLVMCIKNANKVGYRRILFVEPPTLALIFSFLCRVSLALRAKGSEC